MKNLFLSELNSFYLIVPIHFVRASTSNFQASCMSSQRMHGRFRSLQLPYPLLLLGPINTKKRLIHSFRDIDLQ